MQKTLPTFYLCTVWHRASYKLKEKFGMKEGFEICPHQFWWLPIFSPCGTHNALTEKHGNLTVHSHLLTKQSVLNHVLFFSKYTSLFFWELFL